MIHLERFDDVAVIRMAHGKANALDVALLAAFEESLDEVVASDARACVLTGTGPIFSAGVDLKQLVDGGDSYLDVFLPALSSAIGRLFFFPKPVVGAANGHAIAGGCLLFSSCDVRMAARGRGRFGVPELAVGVPFPLMAIEVMRFSTPVNRLQEVLYSGRAYDVEEALERGLVDEVVDAERLDERALATARTLAGYPESSFRFTKELVRRPVAQRLAKHAATDDRSSREIWGSSPVRGAVARYVESTLEGR